MNKQSIHKVSLSLHFNGRTVRFQNVPFLDFITAKGDGGSGDNWSYNMCKAPVKSSPPTNQHPASYRLDALTVAHLQCHSTEGSSVHMV